MAPVIYGGKMTDLRDLSEEHSISDYLHAQDVSGDLWKFVSVMTFFGGFALGILTGFTLALGAI